MRIFVFPVERCHLTVFIHLPTLTAGITGKIYSLSLHFAFREAMGTFIKHSVKAVRAEGLIDLHLVILLPRKIIKGELLLDNSIDLVRRHILKLICGKQILHICGDLDPSYLQAIIKRIPVECAVRLDHNKRNAESLHHITKAIGKCGCLTVKAITRLGIHQHRAAERLYRIIYIADKI